MSEYALLMLPSANRVYSEAAVELATAELDILNDGALGGQLTDIGQSLIAGTRYLTFRGSDLAPDQLAQLSNLSAAYALFERRESLLAPVALTPLEHFDDDLVTIPKYPGKTNEQFTKLLLNITLLSATAPVDLRRRMRVLDPLCGRGTTLNQALIYGYDTAGLDLDGRDFDAYAAFLSTYLKRKRLKHKINVAPVRRERRVIAKRLTASVVPQHRAADGAEPLRVDVVLADTTAAPEFFRAASFDAVVADAPYGVQHGSRTVAAGLRRAPVELLAQAVPVWTKLLRPGAALGLSFNVHTAPRDELAGTLTAAGLTVLDHGPYRRMRHRVDQAIIRDVLIARRPP